MHKITAKILSSLKIGASTKLPFIKGAFFLVLYAVFSSLNDVCMKFVNTNTVDTIFWRNLCANIVLLPLVIRSRPQITLKSTRNHFIRALVFGISMICYVSALKRLPLSLVVAINFSIPLWVVLFACIFLKEAWRERLISVIIGLIGIFITCMPTFENTNWIFTLIMILATIGFASLDVFNKYLLNQEETIVMMLFGSNLFITMLCLPIFSYTIPAQPWAFIYLGIGANLVLYFLLKAWKSCDISALQPIKYIEFPLAILFGTAIFKDTTHWMVFLGVGVLLIGVFLNIAQEMKSKK